MILLYLVLLNEDISIDTNFIGNLDLDPSLLKKKDWIHLHTFGLFLRYLYKMVTSKKVPWFVVVVVYHVPLQQLDMGC